MDSMVNILLDRANNEIMAANSLKKLSEDQSSKKEFMLPESTTFYSSVISHSYYAIFYSTKAILLTKGIRTHAPEIHRKTYDAFKQAFVETGILDVALLEIYSNLAVRADMLLEIFSDEKWKRGHYTYTTFPQANMDPASKSLENSRTFVSNIEKAIRGA